MTNKEKAHELVSKMTFAEKLSQTVFTAASVDRLGIPAYNWWNEALHGYARSGVATVFPQAIGLAATFDPDMMRKVASAISDEARAKFNEYRKNGKTDIYQGITCWSPNINIFRDPRWGRGQETYGEDPYLTARMGTSFVRGLQEGDDPEHRKTDATLKHLAAHSGPEKGRHSFDSRVSRKDLFETYLFAFEYCIKHADPAAIMGAYNRLNGEPCCGSRTLLQDIIRERFGFKGYVVSDCGAICDINAFHKVTSNEAESAALCMNAGCDLNCGSAYKFLKTAAAMDLVDEETVTRSVERLFETRYRLGMFDETVYDRIPYDVVDCDEHRKLALEMSRRVIVMLKNNGILPLRNKKIAVIGPNADCKESLLGNYNGIPSSYHTILSGIQEISGEFGSEVFYAFGTSHMPNGGGDRGTPDEAYIVASRCDAVVLCLGYTPQLEGEEGDAGDGDRLTISLPDNQLELFRRIRETGKPIVVVNVSGSATDLRFADAEADAVLQCFYPGQDGGLALAEILFGKCDSTARLPVTFYTDDSQLPDISDYSMKGRTYRYFEGTPLYPFGYGMSYNKYTLSDMNVDTADGVKVGVSVCNNGNMDSADVIQVYISYPDIPGSPIRTLVQMKRLPVGAGGTESAVLEIEPECLCVFDDDGNRQKATGRAVITVSDGMNSVSREITL